MGTRGQRVKTVKCGGGQTGRSGNSRQSTAPDSLTRRASSVPTTGVRHDPLHHKPWIDSGGIAHEGSTLVNCWCLCPKCFDKDALRCICRDCPCPSADRSFFNFFPQKGHLTPR
jgi:hypothetical protein